MAVRFQPEGYHTATPYLICSAAAQAIDFYKRVFGAQEIMRMPMPGGKVGHAELRIGDSVIMLADEAPEMGYRSPKAVGGTPVSIMLYLEDADRVFEQAVAAGARVDRGMEDKFYGDRAGSFYDPAGHLWTVATHKEDVSQDEMKRRMQAMMGKSA